MQNRYAGDVGDYLKLALLKAISPAYRLRVAWWLVPDECHNSDGRHITYLDDPATWRQIDPALFDCLQAMVKSGKRSVADLQALRCLPEWSYASSPIPTPMQFAQRPFAREKWFQELLATLANCDLIFAAPDNGLEPVRYKPQSSKASKSVKYAELRALADGGRPVIVYHHQTRRKGGHIAEVEFLARRFRAEDLRRVDAVRARPFSPRVFFILNASDDLASKASAFVSKDRLLFSWHPDAETS